MLLWITVLLEVLATMVFLYYIYGRKFVLDIKVSAFIFCITGILIVINQCHLNGVFSFVGYILICLYCKFVFRSKIISIIKNFVITMIFVTIVQFVSLFLLEIFIKEENLEAIITNFILLVFIFIITKYEVFKIPKSISKKTKFLIPVFGFVCLVIVFILLQKKLLYKVKIEYFVFTIPAIVIILFMVVKWHEIHFNTEDIKKCLELSEQTQEMYNDLILKTRLRQHEFKNHLAAIFSFHYTYKTYEQLVEAQEEYCKRLMKENKFNSLLSSGNSMLAGYLVGKFQEIELNGIEVDYKIKTNIVECRVPVYFLIEMMGILLDNAVEALKDKDEKRIFMEIKNQDSYLLIIMQNPYQYVPYNEILEWFLLGKSDKGNERGVGLYHLKCLCEEWKCYISCRNIEVKTKNWISFTLQI